MKSFFQRHSGTRKPTSDSTTTYQVWLPPSIESRDDRTRYRTSGEPLTCTDASRADGKSASNRTRNDSIPHITPSRNDYTTYPSTGRGSHVPTNIPPTATPSYPDPGQYLGGSAGWSTSQRPLVSMWPPSVGHTPTAHREDDAQRRKRSDDRYRDADNGGERERRTLEREADVARYKARVVEKSGRRKDYVQQKHEDEDRRGVSNDEREKKDRRRNREKIRGNREKESESDRNHDREQGRNERTGVHGRAEEYQEAHRFRERGKDRTVDRVQPTEGHTDRDVTRDLRSREREKGNVDRREKARKKDDGFGRSEREHRRNGKEPAKAGRYGVGEISGVHKNLREEHPYMTDQPREREDEFKQGRQHNDVRELDQRECRRDIRKEKNYLNRRFEPGSAEWDSASMRSPQHRKRHRYNSAHDGTDSDSSPRKGLPRPSKDKCNLAKVEADHVSIMERLDSVPSAPPDLALTYSRQAVSPSSSRENQARYANLNYPSLPLGHRETSLTLVSPERLSRVDTTAIATSLGEVGHSKHKEHQTIENNPNPVLSEFPRERLALHDAEPLNSNAGRSKYDEVSDSLSSRWHLSKKRSSPQPSPLMDHNPSVVPAEKQRLAEQLDQIPKKVYTTASRQAALREVEMFSTSKYITRTVENHSKLLSTDAPSVGCSGSQNVTHQGRHLSNPNTNSIPSGFPADTHASVVRESRIESHWHRPEMTTSRTTDPQTPNILKVMQPRLQARDQTSQILFNPGSRASSDTPTVDISRKPLEFIASKDRPLTAQSIRETPNHLYNVDPVHDQTSMQIRTTSYGIQAEQTPEEIAPGKSSQCHDTSPTFLNHMHSTLSTPVVVGITGSIAQTLVTLPSIRQSSAHGPTAVREDVSLQIHPDLGNAIRSSSSQGAHHPSVTSDIVAEHKVTEQFLTYLPNTRPVDDTLKKNSKVSSSLDIPTHLIHSHIQTKPMEYPLSQQGQPGSFPSMEITNTLPHRPATRQLSSTEHLPQNICNARTDRTPLDNNASRSQIHISHHLQEASAGSDTKARALPTSIEPSSAVVLNENTGHLQHTDINMADQASTQTRTARVPDQTYPAMTETETKSSRSLSIVQQRKMTDMRAEAVHIEEMPIAPGATNDVDNPTSWPTTFIPSSSDADLNRVSSPSNQLVRSTGFAGSPLEVSANVNEQTSSSCLADPVIAAKDRNLLQSKRPDEFGNVGTSTSRDVIHIDSRYANTKANDIGGVITSSVNSATVNSISLPSDQITSDGPSRYRSSTESLVQRYSDKGQRFPPELKPSVSKLRTEYKASLIPSQAQSEAATQILRPATAIGYRQISGEGSIPLLTGMRDVPSGNKASISAIQRPATAMSSRHLLSERPRIHSVLQAPNVEAGPLTLLQSRLTGPSNGVIPTHNRAISSTQSINKLVVPLSTKPERASSKHMWNEAQSNSDHRYEEKLRNMQLHGQQLNTNTSGPELEHPVNKNGVPSLGHTHGAPLRPPPGDLPLVQHHVVSNTSFRDDSNVASSSRSQPRESIGRAIAVSKGDQLPIQNARLAELLSNAVPLHEQTPPNALNNLETSRPVISRSGQSSVVRPGVEQPTLQMTQPEPTSLNHKRVPEKHSQDAGSRTSPVLKSARISEQYGPLENHTTPSMGMLASTSQQGVPGDNHTLPPIADTTAQSRINQDHLVGSKSQKHIAPQIGNHGSHSSTIHVQKTQKHPHTHDDPNKGPRRGTVELSPTQPSPVNNTHPAGVTQLTSHHQTSQRATRNKDQSKASQKHNPVFQSSHTASIDTAVVPNSSTSGDFPLKVSATHKSSHQRPQGVLSTRDNDYHRSSHKLAMASSSKHLVPPSNVRPDVSSTQRTELHSHRSRTTTPINNPSSSQVDLMLNRHVLPSSSQVPQPSLQRNVYVPSPSVTSSVKPRTSRNHGQTAMRSTSAVPPSKTYPNQQGDTAFEAPIHTIQPPALQQSIPTSALPPDPALSRSRRPSEDSVLLRTPSSLTPTILKPSISRTSIPASFSSQTSSKKRGLFSMFRSKLSQSPDQGEESKKQAQRKLRKETKPRAESFSAAAPPPDIKVTSAASARVKAPPIVVPIGVQPVTESKSPNKVFTPFRYLTTKRNRRVSQASLEAQDGTAPNTIIGSPTASIHSSQPPPIQAPPLRDVFAATQEWRRMEAAEVREVTGGKLRRARPGVVFDVAEDHTEEDRPKIRPQSRQS